MDHGWFGSVCNYKYCSDCGIYVQPAMYKRDVSLRFEMLNQSGVALPKTCQLYPFPNDAIGK